MDKIFAKTLFLGKKVYYLTQCHSTNDIMLEKISQETAREGDVVLTAHQMAGRGQQGNSWESEPGKNLLFSVLLKPRFIALKEQYLLTIIAGMAVADVLSATIRSKQVKVKWPNDVYVGDRKIAGMLTESSIAGTEMEYAILGIGLNVNQTYFENPHATSVRIETNETMNMESLLEMILQRLEYWYLKIKSGQTNQVREAYVRYMYRYNEEYHFETTENRFSGTIKGIDGSGHLLIEVDGALRSFRNKEVKYL